MDYFSRIGLLLSQGKPCCDVLVVNSVESVWSQVHPGWAKMLVAKVPEITRLEEQYQDLFYWLSGAYIDFDYGDEEMISRYYRIEQDQEGNPILKIGELTARRRKRLPCKLYNKDINRWYEFHYFKNFYKL